MTWSIAVRERDLWFFSVVSGTLLFILWYASERHRSTAFVCNTFVLHWIIYSGIVLNGEKARLAFKIAARVFISVLVALSLLLVVI